MRMALDAISQVCSAMNYQHVWDMRKGNKRMSEAPTVMGTKAAANRLGVAEGTLRYWRHVGAGPRSFRLGGRMVKYRVADLDAWLDEQYARDSRGGEAS